MQSFWVLDLGNGTSQTLDPSTGVTIEKHPDGSFAQFNPDGRIVRGDPDGSQTILNPDHTSMQRNPNGSIVVTLRNGTNIIQHLNSPAGEANPQPKQVNNKLKFHRVTHLRGRSRTLAPPTTSALPEKARDRVLADLIDSTVFYPNGCTLFFPDRKGLTRLSRNKKFWKQLTRSPKFKRCFLMQHLVPNVRLELTNASGVVNREIVSLET